MSSEHNSGKWSFDTDVVVVGSGGCGLSAAIAAGQGGAEVLLLEKQKQPLSNTARSGGMIPAAGTRLQAEAGILETPEEFSEDIFRKNGHTSDPEMTLHLAHISKDLIEWLIDEVGVDLVFSHDFKYPGHSEFRMHVPPNRTGAALVLDLRRAADDHPNIEIFTDAPGVGLILNKDGAVIGIDVQRGANRERVKAKKVILACNGFAGNPEMVLKYCPEISDALYFGGEGNTGDGIIWGLEAGAEVAFMDAFQAHASVAVPHNILVTYALIMEGGIQVNQRGERFGNESAGYSKHALAVISQPDHVAWDIYDKRLHQLGLKFEDYRDAIEAGAIKDAQTIPELADVLGIDQQGLQTTFDQYQSAARGESEDSFDRPDCSILEAPFYGAKVTGALFHTQGGLKVDKNARVLKPDGTPIPNLYAGGGVAAGISGHGAGGYLSGNGLLTALGYGMLAGRHAALAISETAIG